MIATIALGIIASLLALLLFETRKHNIKLMILLTDVAGQLNSLNTQVVAITAAVTIAPPTALPADAETALTTLTASVNTLATAVAPKPTA